ncbi:MAG: HAMP domain-containing sensor histidine kinase [Candidatus Pseudobacter hemicellulosilyticus]|uniref:histidine kinase n=1 Tax=Candidatus Pseudobacter hemicellulosilyticus TaxID=3121375 RepID=A0AAJ5WRC1_9BACT|nr:MAG: HAMP domain-containing sensor histidine kinase [Pseudobacter sp.]
MRASTLKWIVLLSTLLITAIVGVQLFWLNKIYSFEQKTFNTNVVKSIRGLYEDIAPADTAINHLQDVIEHPDPDYFLFRVSPGINRDSLVWFLKDELNDFDVLTDVHIAFYEARKKQYTSRNYIAAAAARYEEKEQLLPLYERSKDYVLLFFPHRNKYVLAQMNFWFISTGILFIVLIGLVLSLVYFYRQKFLAEVQKDFVNNFTHEFKTPLAVMKISADVLLQEKIIQQPDRLQQYATIIQHQTEHLQHQVERLLQIAASDRRELPIQRTAINISDTIRQAVAKVQPLADSRQARIDVALPPEPVQLLADGNHLELALVNLLENALKYSGEPHIVVSTGQEEGHAFISVKDNGIGIDKKYHKNLFRKFYRVPTGDVHNVKGFGLGLNFVKRIMDAHHGTIRINSLPGIGTEFRLLLPNH